MEQIINKYATPQRQSRVAIGIILIKFVKITIRSFWPILIGFFVGKKSSDSFIAIVGYIAIGFAALNLLGSVLTYFRFYFYLDDGAIVIDKGILKRTKTNIPFERIQTINFKQNILHQIFGVVSLEIDTAGAKKSELTIDALKKEDAEALRSFILKEKAQIVTSDADDQERIVETEEAERVVLHLSVPDLFKVGISQNHLKSMGILFAFVFSTLNEYTDDVPDLIADQLSGYDEVIVNSGWIMFLLSVIVVGIISFAYSLITTVLSNYDLKLSIQQSGGLKLVKGLLNREEISVNKRKVQIVSWSDNPIRMMFNMFTMQIEQASSAEADQLKSKIRVPGSYQAQVDSVVRAVFPEEFYRPEEQHRVSKLLKYRLFAFIGVIPALTAVAVSFSHIEWQSLYFLIWIVFIWLTVSAYYRKRTYEVNDELLRNNRGTFGHIYELIQLYKIQSVVIKQSWYQRRKQLATIILSTAAGSVKVPFIHLGQAEALESFILYRIESDKREWM